VVGLLGGTADLGWSPSAAEDTPGGAGGRRPPDRGV